MLLLDTLRGPRAPGRGANPSGVFHGLCLNKIHERNYPECCTSKLNLGANNNWPEHEKRGRQERQLY